MAITDIKFYSVTHQFQWFSHDKNMPLLRSNTDSWLKASVYSDILPCTFSNFCNQLLCTIWNLQLKVGWFYVPKDTWCGWKLTSILYSSHVLTLHICAVSFTVITGGSNKYSQKYTCHPQILGATWVTLSQYHTEDPQSGVTRDSCYLALSARQLGTWHIFLYVKEKIAVILLKPYGVSEQNLVAPMCQLLTPFSSHQII